MDAKCSCPTKFDDHTRAVVRAGLDQFCPLHGTKKQELPHCATCRCGELHRAEKSESLTTHIHGIKS